MTDVDHGNTARMKQIVARYGWPGYKLVAKDGAHQAWLLVQHADADLAFQTDCLAKLESAVAAGDASPTHLAYLHDRVAVAEKRKQRYGTQYGAPIEDRPRERNWNVSPAADSSRRSDGGHGHDWSSVRHETTAISSFTRSYAR